MRGTRLGSGSAVAARRNGESAALRGGLARSAYEFSEVHGRHAIAFLCQGRRAAWANLGSGPADVAARFADRQHVSADATGAGRRLARVVGISDSQRGAIVRGGG